MAAGLAAYRRHSFKKAARFARTLLERDSINPHARNLLISCHLAHARKQVRAGRYDLVEPELDAAESFARDAEQRGIVTLNRGLVALSRNATRDSESLLARGLQQLGGGLIARFRFLVDGLRLGLSLRNLTRQVNQLQERMPNPERQDIVRLAELLHRYLDDGVKELPTVLERLQAPIKAAATLEFTEQEMQAVCAAFRRARVRYRDGSECFDTQPAFRRARVRYRAALPAGSDRRAFRRARVRYRLFRTELPAPSELLQGDAPRGDGRRPTLEQLQQTLARTLTTPSN